MAGKTLSLSGTIGFSGTVPAGLHCLPDREHLVYPIGANIVIESIGKGSQSYLDGHNDNITCLAVSADGRLMASGQQTHRDHVADVCLWDLPKRRLAHRLSLHKTQIAALAFSPSGAFLVTLGTVDDGRVTVWDTATGKAIAGSVVASRSGGSASAVAFASTSESMFATAGDSSLRLWTLDAAAGKLSVVDCTLGSLKRQFTCLSFSPSDDQLYGATSSGDIVLVEGMKKNNPLLKLCGPEKTKFVMGVQSMSVLKTGDMLVGAGDGSVALVKPSAGFKQDRVTSVEGAVTSIAIRGEGHEFFVGTNVSTIARVTLADFSAQVRSTAHHMGVTDIAFPAGTAALLATASAQGIRVWSTANKREVLRINLANKNCQCLAFLPNGKLIISGWNDGAIRAYLPESGKLKFEIVNAHDKGVTALALTPDNKMIVSGGMSGQMRLWDISSSTQQLVATTSQHRAAITSICISKARNECITSSKDGSCIIWDLAKHTQKKVLLAATQFSTVLFRPDEAQILTTGSDRKVGYWESFDGSLIREVEVAAFGLVASLDVAPDGRSIVVGGADRIVKLFSFNECERLGEGPAHCSDITRVKFACDQSFVVTATTSGTLYFWSLR